MRLAFLRHGPTDWNATGRIQGSIDIALSQAGLAKMAACRLPFTPARVYVSPMLRARQTVEALGLGSAIADARLAEQNWGSWEGLTRAQILEQDGGDAFVRAGSAQREGFRPPGGESTGEVHDRVAAFLRDVATGEGDAVAVTHLGVLRAAYTLASGWGMDAPMPPELDTSRILVLEVAQGGTPAIAEMNVDFISRTVSTF